VVTEPQFGVDAATTEAELDRWATEVQAKADRYGELQREVTAVSATALSSDGSVTVSVDSGGAILDLRFTEQLKQLPASRMAEMVLTTMRRAQAKIADQVSEIVRERIGDDPVTADAMVNAYQSRFPDPEPEQPENPAQKQQIGTLEEDEEPTAERPRPRSRLSDDDTDEFDGGSIFR
jgi:DNA-binding protein YbaB